jgi:hypothetical protein
MSPNETPVIAHPFILIRQRDHRARQFTQYLFGVLTESQQVGQAGQGASMLEEVVLQQLVGGGSASNIDAKAHRQESLELLAELLWFLQTWCAVGGNEVECFKRLFIKIWRLGFDHFNCHNTKRPNVNFGAIFLLLDDLRSHPIWRADHGGSLRLGFSEFGTETKIGYDSLVTDTT